MISEIAYPAGADLERYVAVAQVIRDLRETAQVAAPYRRNRLACRDDIEQPAPASSAAFLDSIADRLMFRLQYRNFGTHQSLVVNHTVKVSGVAPTTPGLHQAGVGY